MGKRNPRGIVGKYMKDNHLSDQWLIDLERASVPDVSPDEKARGVRHGRYWDGKGIPPALAWAIEGALAGVEDGLKARHILLDDPKDPDAMFYRYEGRLRVIASARALTEEEEKLGALARFMARYSLKNDWLYDIIEEATGKRPGKSSINAYLYKGRRLPKRAAFAIEDAAGAEKITARALLT